MRFGARTTLIPGLVLGIAGLLLFTRAPVDGSYVEHVLPVMVLLGAGAGISFPALMGLSMSGATPSDAGLASGLVNTTLQVGGALGLAVLATLSTTRTENLQRGRRLGARRAQRRLPPRLPRRRRADPGRARRRADGAAAGAQGRRGGRGEAEARPAPPARARLRGRLKTPAAPPLGSLPWSRFRGEGRHEEVGVRMRAYWHSPRAPHRRPRRTGSGRPGWAIRTTRWQGNGGIDVRDYSLRLAYEPVDAAARGARAAEHRRDAGPQALRPRPARLRARPDVTVDGRPARVLRDGQELMITPSRPPPPRPVLHRHRALRGRARGRCVDPDGSSEGFVPTADGAVVVGEPQGSPGWYPANDTPRDKATYTVQMTVPEGLTAVGNGALEAPLLPARPHDVPMARALPDGAVPGHDHARPLQRRDGPDAERRPDLRGGRPDPGRRGRPDAGEAARHGLVPRAALRPLPVRDRRRDRRRRAGARLRARDPDEAGVRLGAVRGDAAARARAHVVRRRRDAADLARHLAARGLRDLVGVDLGRARRRPDGGRAVRRAGGHAGRATASSGTRRPGTRAGRRPCSPAASTTAAR